MKRTLSFLLVLLLAVALAVPTAAQQEIELTFIHDTHVHGSLGEAVGLTHQSAVIQSIKARRPGAVWLGAGDELGPKLGTTYQGRHLVDAFNRLGLTATAVGNHEFDFGPDVFLERVRESTFTWLSANMLDRRTGKTFGAEAGVKPWTIITMNGVRVGLTGVTNPQTPTASQPGPNADFIDPIAATRQAVAAMKAAGAQVVIVLLHASHALAEQMAAQVEGIDAILGDHEETILEQPLVVGNTLISRAGAEYKAVGELTFKLRDGRRVGHEFRLHRLSDQGARDPAADAIVQGWMADYDRQLGVQIATSLGGFDSFRDNVRWRETAIANIFADAVREYTGADVAIMNGGGLGRTDRYHPAGPVTKKDIVSMAPFANTVVMLEVTGELLLQALENGVALDVGTGRFPHVSGMSFTYDLRLERGRRIVTARVGGRPVDRARKYLLAVNSFMAGGGDGYEMLKGQPFVKYDPGTGPLFNEVVMAYLQRQGTIRPLVEGRITALGVLRFTAGETRVAFHDRLSGRLDVAPAARDGRVWVPLRFVAELYGENAHWDGQAAWVRGTAVRPGRDAMIQNGRMLVTAEVLRSLFGARVQDDGSSLTLVQG